MRKMPTIIDVAKLAGVSLGTASQALNNKSGVAPSTVIKVKKAAVKLNYHPSITARQLRKRKSNTISLYIPIPLSSIIYPSTWAFYFPIIQGFMETIKNEGYRIHFEFIGMKELSHSSYLEPFIIGHQVHGVAFIITDRGDFSGLLRLSKLGVNIVTIYSKISDVISSIQTDNFQSSKHVTKWLMSLGHEMIGFINGEETQYAAVERKNGYLSGITRNEYCAIYQGNWTIDSGIEGLKYFIEQKSRPTAIFCANDHMAIGVMKACRELKICIPSDISIIGFDDDFICQVAEPQLTSVRMPLRQMGSEGAMLLITRNHEDIKKPEHKMLQSQLIIRNTVTSLKVH